MGFKARVPRLITLYVLFKRRTGDNSSDFKTQEERKGFKWDKGRTANLLMCL